MVLCGTLVMPACTSASQAYTADRAYTPIACEEGTGDCDGRLSTGCEARVILQDCCGTTCSAGEWCNGSRGRCQP
jgi:hypothetical protein